MQGAHGCSGHSSLQVCSSQKGSTMKATLKVEDVQGRHVCHNNNVAICVCVCLAHFSSYATLVASEGNRPNICFTILSHIWLYATFIM